MIEIDLNLWNQFEASGKISDYLAFKSAANDSEEEQGNADYDNRNCNS